MFTLGPHSITPVSPLTPLLLSVCDGDEEPEGLPEPVAVADADGVCVSLLVPEGVCVSLGVRAGDGVDDALGERDALDVDVCEGVCEVEFVCDAVTDSVGVCDSVKLLEEICTGHGCGGRDLSRCTFQASLCCSGFGAPP